MAKRRNKSTLRSKSSKVSAVKHINKRLTKLQKQGKLKKKIRSEQPNLSRQKDRNEPISNNIQDEEHDSDTYLEQEEDADASLLDANWSYVSEPVSERKKKRRTANKDCETNFEQVPRKYAKLDDEKALKHLLPIKSKHHGIIPQCVEIDAPKEEDNEVELSIENRANLAVEEKQLPPVNTLDLLVQRHKKLQERKLHIANLASAIIENPEENIHKLKELRLYCHDQDADVAITLKKWAVLSLFEVFKDIAPGYRIRLPTETETEQSQKQKLKKETIHLRDYEKTLLHNYKLYLEDLQKLTEDASRKVQRKKGNDVPIKATQELCKMAVQCLCGLLNSLPHFNYSSNIVAVVVPFMSHKQAKIADLVCDCIKRLFKEDKLGEISLEAVKTISKIVKSHSYNVPSKMLDVFLSLRIKDINLDAETNAVEEKKRLQSRKNRLMKMSRKERKRNKHMEQLERELQEAEATESKSKKTKFQTETIKMVFLTYFRILKKSRKSILLSSVLEGLARFAHLINVEFFDDLISVLHQLVESGDLTRRQMLHCIQTVFKILSGQGQALNIDPMRFYADIYNLLFHISAVSPQSDVELALSCLDIMIIRRRKQVSFQRVLAFIKRLCSLALQLQHAGSIGSLAMAKSIIQLFPKSDILLDTEDIGSGIFLPELGDPEHCNAHNTALWELPCLTRHYHPAVRKYASHVSSSCPDQGQGKLPLELSRKTPVQLCEEYSSEEMNFNPSIPLPSKHAPKKSKKQRHLQTFTSPEMSALSEKIISSLPDVNTLLIEIPKR